MPVFLAADELDFPPSDYADETGLLAIGGKLSPESLLTAYKKGIFPWYNYPEPVCWYTPDPRFVLFPSNLRISKSMHRLLRKGDFQFTMNQCFRTVIETCKAIERPGQDGTWISQDVVQAYSSLFDLGYAISAETWQNERLVGGLYGVKIGNVFFGESMFSEVSNASKFAFINIARQLQHTGLKLIDCQVYTPYLQSFGAGFISRKKFEDYLTELIGE